MAGNNFEWCADCFDENAYLRYQHGDLTPPAKSRRRVNRGGYYGSRKPERFRCSARNSDLEEDTHPSQGIRVAKSVMPVPYNVKEQLAASGTPAGSVASSDKAGQTSSSEPSPPAPSKAKEQQDCAKRLGVPVETTNSIGMKFVLVPSGEFEMGASPEEIKGTLEVDSRPESVNVVRSEGPKHRVKITKPFYMGIFTVTQGDYEKVMGVNPSAFSAKQMEGSAFNPPLSALETENRQEIAPKMAGKDTSRHPVDTVSWNDCLEFCRKLSALHDERNVEKTYRLPTEAEWEYTCRAGTTTRWSFGDNETDLVEYGWIGLNRDKITHPVGEKKPNNWGLFDVHGYMWQWCSDWFSYDYYEQSPPNDPEGPSAGLWHVVRGSFGGYGAVCRCAHRHSAATEARLRTIGFRVAFDIAVKPTEPGVVVTSATPPKPAPTPQQVEPHKKLPVPDESALKGARKLLDETYREKLIKRSPLAEKQSLARELLEQAAKSGKDAASQYVLLQAAVDAATQAADGSLAFEATDRTGEAFEVDVLALKEDVLTKLSKGTHTFGSHQAIAEKTVAVMDEAITQDNFDTAARLGKFALAESLKARDRELSQQIRNHMKDVEQASKAFVEVEVAANRLKTNPGDPGANAIVGRYTCLSKGDWDTGLVMLAKSDDEALKPLAAKELNNPTNTNEQMILADAWYGLAESEKGSVKKNLQLRAAHWYWRAASELSGLEKIKVEKRMKLLAPVVAQMPVPKQIVNKTDGSVLVLIPAGRFLGGKRWDEPANSQNLPIELPSYYLGTYLVTNAQYKKFAEAAGQPWGNKDFSPEKADCPVVVIWKDAQAYCKWAGVRLPTELEWEKGARGTDGRKYPWGNIWDATKLRMKTKENPNTYPVSLCPEGRSPYGLYQMVGNSWQWCADWFQPQSVLREAYRGGVFTPPQSSFDNTRVMRGCGYEGRPDPDFAYSCDSREHGVANRSTVGFRVAKDVMP